MKKLFIISVLVLILLISGCGNKMQQTKIKIETSMGDMEFLLYDEQAPITAENFKKLISKGFLLVQDWYDEVCIMDLFLLGNL